MGSEPHALSARTRVMYSGHKNSGTLSRGNALRARNWGMGSWQTTLSPPPRHALGSHLLCTITADAKTHQGSDGKGNALNWLLLLRRKSLRDLGVLLPDWTTYLLFLPGAMRADLACDPLSVTSHIVFVARWRARQRRGG